MQFDHLNTCYDLGPAQHLFYMRNKKVKERQALPGVIGAEGIFQTELTSLDGSCFHLVDYYQDSSLHYPKTLLPTIQEIPLPYLPISLHPHACGSGYHNCNELRMNDHHSSMKQPEEQPRGTCASLDMEHCFAAKNCEPVFGKRLSIHDECITRKYIECIEGRNCVGEPVYVQEKEFCWSFSNNCVPDRYKPAQPFFDEQGEPVVESSMTSSCSIDTFKNMFKGCPLDQDPDIREKIVAGALDCPTTARLGEEYRCDLGTIQSEANTLTYDLERAELGMDLNPTTGLFRWIPGEVIEDYHSWDGFLQQHPWEPSPEDSTGEVQIMVTDTIGGAKMRLEYRIEVVIDGTSDRTDTTADSASP